jgi:hypothetical protein
VHTRVARCARLGAQTRRADEHDRREQDDRRIEPEQDRHRRGGGEHEREQPALVAPRAEREQLAERREQPLAPASVGEHEQRRQKPDRRPELADRVGGLMGADDPGREQHERAHGRDCRPGQPRTAGDRCAQRGEQRDQRDDERHGRL